MGGEQLPWRLVSRECGIYIFEAVDPFPSMIACLYVKGAPNNFSRKRSKEIGKHIVDLDNATLTGFHCPSSP